MYKFVQGFFFGAVLVAWILSHEFSALTLFLVGLNTAFLLADVAHWMQERAR